METIGLETQSKQILKNQGHHTSVSIRGIFCSAAEISKKILRFFRETRTQKPLRSKVRGDEIWERCHVAARKICPFPKKCAFFLTSKLAEATATRGGIGKRETQRDILYLPQILEYKFEPSKAPLTYQDQAHIAASFKRTSTFFSFNAKNDKLICEAAKSLVTIS